MHLYACPFLVLDGGGRVCANVVHCSVDRAFIQAALCVRSILIQLLVCIWQFSKIISRQLDKHYMHAYMYMHVQKYCTFSIYMYAGICIVYCV